MLLFIGFFRPIPEHPSSTARLTTGQEALVRKDRPCEVQKNESKIIETKLTLWLEFH